MSDDEEIKLDLSISKKNKRNNSLNKSSKPDNLKKNMKNFINNYDDLLKKLKTDLKCESPSDYDKKGQRSKTPVYNNKQSKSDNKQNYDAKNNNNNNISINHLISKKSSNKVMTLKDSPLKICKIDLFSSIDKISLTSSEKNDKSTILLNLTLS